jgi:hypothetical protein
VEHHELKNPSAGPAGKALEYLLTRRDGHGGLVVVVERAQADEILAGLLEGYMLADQIDDVRRLGNLLNKMFGEPCHESTKLLLPRVNKHE